mgnify:CR=1 FL=1
MTADQVEATGVATVHLGDAHPLGLCGRLQPPHARLVTWGRLDTAWVRERLPYPVFPVVVRQSPDPSLPSLPRRLEPPALDDGPHLSYAIQWFLFAGMALTFALVEGLVEYLLARYITIILERQLKSVEFLKLIRRDA